MMDLSVVAGITTSLQIFSRLY